MILSHRLLRYATPALHVLALAANIALVALGAGPLYVVTLVLQLALLLAAALAGLLPVRPLLIARYYVLTTASLAAGLWDWLRHGTSASWDRSVRRGCHLPGRRPAQGERVPQERRKQLWSVRSLVNPPPVVNRGPGKPPPVKPRPPVNYAAARAIRRQDDQ